jgi:hypothetical protein
MMANHRGILQNLILMITLSVPTLTQIPAETKLHAQAIERNKVPEAGSLEARRAREKEMREQLIALFEERVLNDDSGETEISSNKALSFYY